MNIAMQISRAKRMWEIKMEIVLISTTSRCIIPVNMNVLTIVPKTTAATKNCKIIWNIFFERTREVEITKGSTNNGTLTRISLSAYEKSVV